MICKKSFGDVILEVGNLVLIKFKNGHLMAGFVTKIAENKIVICATSPAGIFRHSIPYTNAIYIKIIPITEAEIEEQMKILRQRGVNF